jgi:hypothetical protein
MATFASPPRPSVAHRPPIAARRSGPSPPKSQPSVVETGLKIGAVHVAAAREADRIADAITRTPASTANEPHQRSSPIVQRACASCHASSAREFDEETIARKPTMGPSLASTLATPSVQAGIDDARRGGGGSGLPAETREFFAQHLSRPLPDVRVHADERAATLAQRLDARAFTIGRDVFFGRSEFQPETPSGRRLLAHELVHTIQQTSGACDAVLRRKPLGSETAPGMPLSGAGTQPSAEASREAQAFLDILAEVSLAEMLERVQEIDDGAFLFQVDVAWRTRKWAPAEVERARLIGAALGQQRGRIDRGEVTAAEIARRDARKKRERRRKQIADFEAGRTATPGSPEFERLVNPGLPPVEKKKTRFPVGRNEVKRIPDPERGDQIIWSKDNRIVVYREPRPDLRKLVLERTGSERQADIIASSVEAFYQRLFESIQDEEGNPTLDPDIAHARLVEEDIKLLTMAILGGLISLPTPGAVRAPKVRSTPRIPTRPPTEALGEVLTLEAKARRLWEAVKRRSRDAFDELAPAPVTNTGHQVRVPRERGLTFSKPKGGSPSSGKPGDAVERLGKLADDAATEGQAAHRAEQLAEVAEKPVHLAGVAEKAEVGTKAQRVFTVAEAARLPPPHRGLIFVQERLAAPKSRASRIARDFESETTGTFSDVPSRSRAVPALRYDNPAGGRNFIKLDGSEGLELIDAKTRILTFASRGKTVIPQVGDLRRLNEAARQNLELGFEVVLEFPTPAARAEAEKILKQRRLRFIKTRVRE